MESANGISSGGVVPNVDDLVISFDGNRKIEERVTFVDQTTFKSSLAVVEYPKSGAGITNGVPIGVGNLSNVAILYFNPNDPKLGVEVDFRLPITSIYGSALSYARLFMGSNIGGTGTVISANYDSLNVYINDRLSVERVDIYDDESKRYIVRPGRINVNVPEETMVTLCLYNDSDVMVSYQTLIVKYNGLVSSLVDRNITVTGIELESPYISPTNNKEILIPKNLLSQSFTPRIYKTFGAGSREELFLGTSNVTMYGWGDQVNGDINETFPLVLNYVLATHERSEAVSQFTGTHITNEYRVRITDSDVNADVKLFLVPVYEKSTMMYRLDWYLYSGKRDIALDVTTDVTVSGFSGSKYGEKQNLAYSIDLTNIEGLPDVVYAASAQLMLMNTPMATDTSYRLWYYPDDNRWFGEKLRIKLRKNFGTQTIDVQNAITQKAQWLEELYYRLEPLYDSALVSEAPVPTYVDVCIGSDKVTIDINTYWNGETPWGGSKELVTGENVILKWYTNNDSGIRLDLAVASLPLEVI